jgi:hypothetical protein
MELPERDAPLRNLGERRRQAGGAGRIALVGGEAGTGKNALLESSIAAIARIGRSG